MDKVEGDFVITKVAPEDLTEQTLAKLSSHREESTKH
jgi:hypothetical protein